MSNGVSYTCPTCNGAQVMDDQICSECLGQGSVPLIGVLRFFNDNLKGTTEKLDAIKDVVNAILRKVS